VDHGKFSTLTLMTRSRATWLKLTRFALLCIGLGGCILLAGFGRSAISVVDGAMRPPRMPVEISPQQAGLNAEKITFTTRDGITLAGWIVPSRNGAAVILGHGHAANRTQLLTEAQFLSEAGYGVLSFDWRGHGESGGDRITFGRDEVLDLRAAVDTLSARPEIDPARIGVLGFSMGGAVMLLGAAQDTRIRAVIAESAYADFGETTRYRVRNAPLLWEVTWSYSTFVIGIDPTSIRPVDSICAISPRPVFLIYGSAEDYVHPDSAQELYNAACDPKDLWIIDGAGHGGFIDAEPDEYPRRVLEFFDQHLKGNG
jgi:dipeptidyl aminopeptidase/acylaminoacyl peptidase